MSTARTDAGSLASTAELAELRSLVTHATQRLLGDTITVSDNAWTAPSRLPGWTRGHVATHLARQADALGRLVQGALTGRPQPMYASPEQRDAEIEDGARRTGLELQTDLDTSAQALTESFVAIGRDDAWERTVELRGGDQVPVRLLPLARLSEVVLHHVDLDVGFAADDIEQQTAQWLLKWCAFRLRRRNDFPRLQLLGGSGFGLTVGSSGDEVPVGGPSAALLGWLTGRAGSSALTGAEAIRLPAFG